MEIPVPLGSDSFVTKLEVKLDRRLRTAPVVGAEKRPSRERKRPEKSAQNLVTVMSYSNFM